LYSPLRGYISFIWVKIVAPTALRAFVNFIFYQNIASMRLKQNETLLLTFIKYEVIKISNGIHLLYYLLMALNFIPCCNPLPVFNSLFKNYFSKSSTRHIFSLAAAGLPSKLFATKEKTYTAPLPAFTYPA